MPYNFLFWCKVNSDYCRLMLTVYVTMCNIQSIIDNDTYETMIQSTKYILKLTIDTSLVNHSQQK